ncbi:hypothetical protein [Neisseria arctica]|uniref:hypothetical protein n=1 Tax=Neisseria arctica TaxID=1470200 RepID=UPI0013792FD9|nr:hypothetical protein [Neisseria arctica]UOO85967.1 hypothetical protein LVJ86_06945 [Neisseria arctica]
MLEKEIDLNGILDVVFAKGGLVGGRRLSGMRPSIDMKKNYFLKEKGSIDLLNKNIGAG